MKIIVAYLLLTSFIFFISSPYLITSWFVLFKARGEKVRSKFDYLIAVFMICMSGLPVYIASLSGLSNMILAVMPLIVLPLSIALILKPKDLIAPIDYSYTIGFKGLLLYAFYGLSKNQGINTPFDPMSASTSRIVFTKPRFCVPLVFAPESFSAKVDLILFRSALIGFLFLIFLAFLKHFVSS